MSELLLNGVMEEEAGDFFHICFFTDRHGLDLNNDDNYIFVPKVVCRVIDYRTIAVQDWYVKKKSLQCYISGKSKGPLTQPPQNTSASGVEERLRELKRR
ncbi:MAG: hypothetical protein P9L94_02325 [Candidatus Hinthialibacter antarcticus]|nr:hypothetical protein [Candidatus Hinthialibacter antarcticus]